MRLEEHTYEITSDFADINIAVDTADVWIYHTEEGKATVVCNVHEKLASEVFVVDGVLTVKIQDTRYWYEKIGIHFESPKVAIYLPEEEYGKLYQKSATGGAVISGGLSFESIDVSVRTGNAFCWASAKGMIRLGVTTGEIRLGAESAQSVELKATTGDISLWGVVAEEISVSGTTGDVMMEACDGENITISLTTGDVECSFLTQKVVSAKSTTGKVSVPDAASGSSCKITTTTGNIEVAIKE